MDDGAAPRLVLQLGCDHREYGRYESARLSPRSAWAISVGADLESPSRQFKGDLEFPNEDGLLLVEQGDRVVLAVADAHFGREPSHVLLQDLAERLHPIPTSPAELTEVLEQMAARAPIESGAGSSLLVAVYERRTRAGFGASYFDSTFAIVGPMGHRRPVEFPGHGIVSLARPETLDPDKAEMFDFTAAEGELLLAYTDGIDECHYHNPDTSITPGIMAQLYADQGSDPETYLRALIELALAGVDGNPGGQDNIAVVATRA